MVVQINKTNLTASVHLSIFHHYMLIILLYLTSIHLLSPFAGAVLVLTCLLLPLPFPLLFQPKLPPSSANLFLALHLCHKYVLQANLFHLRKSSVSIVWLLLVLYVGKTKVLTRSAMFMVLCRFTGAQQRRQRQRSSQ